MCYTLLANNLTMTAANTPPSPRTSAGAGNVPASPGSWATVEPPPGSVYDQPGMTFNYARSTYQPTPEQLARDEARHRHLRRNVYAPILAAVLIVVAAFVVILVLAFGVNTPAARSFIAGLSGLTIILMAIPLIAVMSILPLVYFGWWANRRQQRHLYPETGPMAYRSRLQTLLWQLDSLLVKVGRGAERGGAAIAQPLMALHARFDYWREFVRGLRRNYTRGSRLDE